MCQFYPRAQLRRRRKRREERKAVIGRFLCSSLLLFCLHFTLITGLLFNLQTHKIHQILDLDQAVATNLLQQVWSKLDNNEHIYTSVVLCLFHTCSLVQRKKRFTQPEIIVFQDTEGIFSLKSCLEEFQVGFPGWAWAPGYRTENAAQAQKVFYWLLELSTHRLLQPMEMVDLGHMITGVTGLWMNWI